MRFPEQEEPISHKKLECYLNIFFLLSCSYLRCDRWDAELLPHSVSRTEGADGSTFHRADHTDLPQHVHQVLSPAGHFSYPLGWFILVSCSYNCSLPLKSVVFPTPLYPDFCHVPGLNLRKVLLGPESPSPCTSVIISAFPWAFWKCVMLNWSFTLPISSYPRSGGIPTIPSFCWGRWSIKT